MSKISSRFWSQITAERILKEKLCATCTLLYLCYTYNTVCTCRYPFRRKAAESLKSVLSRLSSNPQDVDSSLRESSDIEETDDNHDERIDPVENKKNLSGLIQAVRNELESQNKPKYTALLESGDKKQSTNDSEKKAVPVVPSGEESGPLFIEQIGESVQLVVLNEGETVDTQTGTLNQLIESGAVTLQLEVVNENDTRNDTECKVSRTNNAVVDKKLSLNEILEKRKADRHDKDYKPPHTLLPPIKRKRGRPKKTPGDEPKGMFSFSFIYITNPTECYQLFSVQ